MYKSVVQMVRLVRGNWKKTFFFSSVILYGGKFVNDEYEKNLLLRKYCALAAKYGDFSLLVNERPRQIVILLNPAANKRKAKKEFDKYCAPLFHLSGAAVTILTTDSVNDAVQLTEVISRDVDAVVIAGGDGTVSEVVTGLQRQMETNVLPKKLPVGILPLGRENNIANSLYKSDNKLEVEKLNLLLNATYAIIQSSTKSLNVMKIHKIQGQVENASKPLFSIGKIHWGAFRDAEAAKDKYWYFGPWREYASYIFGAHCREGSARGILQWNPPCSGCISCYQHRQDLNTPHVQLVGFGNPKRWWHAFVPKPKFVPTNGFLDYSKIKNENCSAEYEKKVKSIDFLVTVKNEETAVPYLEISQGPEMLDYFEFVKKGLKIDSEIRRERIKARRFRINPLESENKWLSIDNEDYEVVPMEVTLLQKSLTIFYPCASS